MIKIYNVKSEILWKILCCKSKKKTIYKLDQFSSNRSQVSTRGETIDPDPGSFRSFVGFWQSRVEPAIWSRTWLRSQGRFQSDSNQRPRATTRTGRSRCRVWGRLSWKKFTSVENLYRLMIKKNLIENIIFFGISLEVQNIIKQIPGTHLNISWTCLKEKIINFVIV